MTDALNEQLSALLDGELPAAEAELCLKRLERTEELRTTLSRYALIGEALRATAPVVAARPGFAERVQAALEAGDTGSPGQDGAVAGLRPRPVAARWWRPAAGLGVAATVGTVALLLVGRGPSPVVPAAAPLASVAAPAPAPAGAPSIGDLLPRSSALRLAGNGEPASYVTPLPSRSAVPVRPASEFANYVVAHAEYSSPLGRRAVLSGLVAEEAVESGTDWPAAFGRDPGDFAPSAAAAGAR